MLQHRTEITRLHTERSIHDLEQQYEQYCLASSIIKGSLCFQDLLASSIGYIIISTLLKIIIILKHISDFTCARTHTRAHSIETIESEDQIISNSK